MSFGNQTVGFVTVTLGDPDSNGVRPQIRAQVNVHGCRFRPLQASEKVGFFNTSADVRKCTAPPAAAVLAADAIDELVYDGTASPGRGVDDANVWPLTGDSMPFPDMGAHPFKVTVLCKREKG